AARAVVRAKHGLVTWGDTGEEAYRSTLEFVTRAAEALERAANGRLGLGGQRVQPLEDAEAEDALAAALPVLRGALLEDADGVVLEVDRSAGALAFVSSVRGPEVSRVGAPCPDHLVNTKPRPLVSSSDPDELRRGVAEYAAWYRDYHERNLTDESRPFPLDPAGPRVVLL